MNWYKKAQYNGLMFRGTKTPETRPIARDFPGAYFASTPEEAQNWGKYVSAYKIVSNNFFNPNSTDPYHINPSEFQLLNTFIKKYGYRPSASILKWKEMGAGNTFGTLTEQNYWEVLSNLMLYPTKEWASYLKQLGYDGFINYKDLFLFDLNKAQYVGRYDFKKQKVI